MPSVRNKIDAFEAISKKGNEDPPAESGKGPPKKGRRFLHPKNNPKHVKPEGSSTTLEQLLRPSSGQPRANGQVDSDFQSCLEDVWSVRRNVLVNPGSHESSGKGGVLPTKQAGSRVYSRHSAMSMAAQPASNAKSVGSSRSISFLKKEGAVPQPIIEPLREQNRSSESGKRPVNTPSNDLSSPPQAKRKPFNAMSLLPTQHGNSQGDKKLKYAEKMAAAYRRQAGLGEFLPEVPPKKRLPKENSECHSGGYWKSSDQTCMDDEFDF